MDGSDATDVGAGGGGTGGGGGDAVGGAGGSGACDDSLANVPFDLADLATEAVDGVGFVAVPPIGPVEDGSYVRVLFGPLCTSQTVTEVRFAVAVDPFTITDPWTITAGTVSPLIDPIDVACGAGAVERTLEFGAGVPKGGVLLAGVQELATPLPPTTIPASGWFLVCLRNTSTAADTTAVLNWKGAPSSPRDAWEDPDGAVHAMKDYSVDALDHPWVVVVH